MTLNPLPATRETVTHPYRPRQFLDFDFNANGAIDPATMYDFARDDWLRGGESLCLIGACGTGKSHLLMTLGVVAAAKGYQVRYLLARRLIDDLVSAPDDKQLVKLVARYGDVDLLIVDDFGCMELDRRSAELLLQVFTVRQDTTSIAIASDRPLSQWLDPFKHLSHCVAIVDRLTCHGTTIDTGAHPYSAPRARNGHH